MSHSLIKHTKKTLRARCRKSFPSPPLQSSLQEAFWYLSWSSRVWSSSPLMSHQEQIRRGRWKREQIGKKGKDKSKETLPEGWFWALPESLSEVWKSIFWQGDTFFLFHAYLSCLLYASIVVFVPLLLLIIVTTVVTESN